MYVRGLSLPIQTLSDGFLHKHYKQNTAHAGPVTTPIRHLAPLQWRLLMPTDSFETVWHLGLAGAA